MESPLKRGAIWGILGHLYCCSGTGKVLSLEIGCLRIHWEKTMDVIAEGDPGFKNNQGSDELTFDLHCLRF